MSPRSWLGMSLGICAATAIAGGEAPDPSFQMTRTRTEAIAHRIAQKKRRAAKKARRINRRRK
jgi:hypothetical protein